MVEWLCPYWPSKILFWIIWKPKILSCCLLYKWFSSSKETEWTKQKMVVCVPKQKRFTGLLIRKIAVLLPDLVITIYLFELLWKEYLTFLHLQRRKTYKHGQEKWACACYQHRWFSRMSGSSCTQCDLWISHILRGLFFFLWEKRAMLIHAFCTWRRCVFFSASCWCHLSVGRMGS